MTTAWQTRWSPEPVSLTWYIPTLYILHSRAVNFLFKKETASQSDEKWTFDMNKCLTKCHFSPSWHLFFQNGQGYILHLLHQAVFHCKKCCVKIIWKLNKTCLIYCQILEKYHLDIDHIHHLISRKQ